MGQLEYKNARTGYSGVSVKQAFILSHFTYGNYISLLVGLNKGRLRLRYPNYSSSKVHYLDEATLELKQMCAMLLAELIPAGIVADKLQEEFPSHEKAAQILRQWQVVRDTMKG